MTSCDITWHHMTYSPDMNKHDHEEVIEIHHWTQMLWGTDSSFATQTQWTVQTLATHPLVLCSGDHTDEKICAQMITIPSLLVSIQQSMTSSLHHIMLSLSHDAIITSHDVIITSHDATILSYNIIITTNITITSHDAINMSHDIIWHHHYIMWHNHYIMWHNHYIIPWSHVRYGRMDQSLTLLVNKFVQYDPTHLNNALKH